MLVNEQYCVCTPYESKQGQAYQAVVTHEALFYAGSLSCKQTCPGRCCKSPMLRIKSDVVISLKYSIQWNTLQWSTRYKAKGNYIFLA